MVELENGLSKAEIYSIYVEFALTHRKHIYPVCKTLNLTNL